MAVEAKPKRAKKAEAAPSDQSATEADFRDAILSEAQWLVSDWLGDNQSELDDGGWGETMDLVNRIARLCRKHPILLQECLDDESPR